MFQPTKLSYISRNRNPEKIVTFSQTTFAA